MEYKEYLKSEHWKKLKSDKFKKKDRGCAFCCSKINLDVHHLVYADDLESIKTKDVRVLCRKCHSFTHFLFKKGFIKFKDKTRHDRFSDTKHGFTKFFGLARYTLLKDIWDRYEYKKDYEFGSY